MHGSDLIKFINIYLSTVRRYSSLLPEERRHLLPDFWSFPFQIQATICKDGIVIEFRRKIRKKVDSIRISHKNSINNIIPLLTGSEVAFPAEGLEGILVKDLAITTESCYPFLKPGGTLFSIKNHFGITKVTSGGDIFFENVVVFFLDKNGVPKQYRIKGMWLLANDSPLLFTSESAKKRSFNDFVKQLVKTGAILGKKKQRYTEFDFRSEIDTIEIEYLTLINSENISEHEMQEFLEKHKFIISPLYLDISPTTINIKPQTEISTIKRRIDFVLMQEPIFIKNNIAFTAIEIKKPSDKLFLKNGDPSQALKVGIEQIITIFKYVDSNLLEAKKIFPINKKSDLKGYVLIGRRKELDLEDVKRVENFNNTNNRIKIVLYNDLLENIKFVSDVFGKKIQQPAVYVGQAGTEDEDFTGKTAKVIQEAINFLAKRMEENEI